MCRLHRPVHRVHAHNGAIWWCWTTTWILCNRANAEILFSCRHLYTLPISVLLLFCFFVSVVTMSVLAQGLLRSTFLQMTPLPTPSWTPVKEGQSRRGSHPAAWSVPRSVGGVPRVPPGSPPPTTRWDCSSRSSQTSHPSPYHRRQRRPTSRCWPSRDSRCRWCHVTFLSTNQRAGATAGPPSLGWTTSCRTINLGLTVGRAGTLIDVLHREDEGSSCNAKQQTLKETHQPTPRVATNVRVLSRTGAVRPLFQIWFLYRVLIVWSCLVPGPGPSSIVQFLSCVD